MAEIIDLSQKIENGMPVFPGDRVPELFQTSFICKDGYNNYQLETGMHVGTHIDSPMHMYDTGRFISEAPLDKFIATGSLLDVRGQKIITVKPEYEEIIKENSILLLYTGWDEKYGTPAYYEDHPCIGEDFCRLLIMKNVKMLGVDLPSPDKYPFESHKLLLKNNIFILENLTNLNQLMGVPEFEVIAIPLKINADSSVTRAVARIL